MTRRAVLGRGLVKQHGLAFHRAHLFVAPSAAHVAMHSLQRKGSAGVVVEKRWLPLGAVVTLGAGRGSAGFRKLRAVDIGVAAFAGRRGYFEICIDEAGLKVWGLVAVDASYGAVCSD